MRGHYVSDCPTNEDPKYDITAGFDYVCKFCKERGTHYFLFCPSNTDPNSIYKRRQDRAFQNLQASASHGDQLSKRTIASLPRSPESPSPATPSRSKIVVTEFSTSTAEFDLFTKMKRTSSRNANTESFRDDNNFDDMGKSMVSVAIGDAQGERAEEDDELRIRRFETLGLSEGDMIWERLKNNIQREHSRGLQMQSIIRTKQIVRGRLATKSTEPTTTNKSPDTDFLSKLFKRHPSQPNPNCRPRMTALEMWEINDEKKRLKENMKMARMAEREPSAEPSIPNSSQMRNLPYRSDQCWDDSVDVMEVEYPKDLGEDRKQDNFLLDTKGFNVHKKHQEKHEESPNREEKMRAIQKKIKSIEGLRTKLASGEDVDSPEMEQMASGDLSQEELDDISRRMRAPEPLSPSGLTSSSSELSSPPRLSSSGSRRGKGGFLTT